MTGGELNGPVPLYQTDLVQAPLPEILLKIHRYKVPGVIECRRGAETKRVYLDEGHIIFATTNQVVESLGDTLVRERRLTQEQYEESVRHMKLTGMRHGVTLVNMGLLTKEQLFTTVRAQMQEIIDSMFEWSFGAVAFTPGRDKEKAIEFVKLDLSVPNAILRGVRRIVDGRALVARLGEKATLFERTATRYDDLTLSADEQTLLSAVDGKRALFQLVTATHDQGANARLLYGFLTLGLIARREARQVKVQIKIEGPPDR